MSTEATTATAAAPQRKTKALTDLQIQKLFEASEDANNMQAELQRAEQAAKKAKVKVQDMVSLILDAVGAPQNSQISMQHGVIVWPESPADADVNGVSKAAEVPSPASAPAAPAPAPETPAAQ